jgi:hypothetical protein
MKPLPMSSNFPLVVRMPSFRRAVTISMVLLSCIERIKVPTCSSPSVMMTATVPARP